MLYAIFDNFHALVNPIRQDILRGGGENRRFCVFLTLEVEFLTTYEVSRPLRRRKPFIASRSIDSSLFEKILAAGNFNFKLKFMLKKITVYTKRSPSYEDCCDIIIVPNSLN